MSFKLKSSIIGIALCTPLFYLMDTWTDVFRFLSKYGRGKGDLIYLAISFVSAVLLTLIIQLTSKSVKNQNVMEDELRQNGLSDRFCEVAQKELARFGPNEMKLYHFKYLLLLTVGYARRNRIQDALNTINRINPEIIYKRINVPSTRTMFALQYYDAQVCICEMMNDIGRLDNVMEAGKKLFDENAGGKDIMNKMLLDEIYSIYYAMHGEYEEAMKFADHCISLNNHAAEICGYGYKAKIYARMGQVENANEFIRTAESMIKNPLERQEIEDLKSFVSKLIQNS